MDTATILKNIYSKLGNKFILTLAVFFMWMLIFDRSNWIDMFSEIRKIHSLEKERIYFLEKIENDRSRLNELRTSNENLEKFAREQYLMKKPDEEIFVISPE
jgi:cell division protein FtsB